MSTLESAASQPTGVTGLTAWVKRHALLAYIGLTFGLTWPVMLAEVLGSWGLISFRLSLTGSGLLLTLPLAYSPTIAALIITGMVSGKAGLRTLLGRLLLWRVGWRWYAAALLLPAVMSLGAVTLQALRSGTPVILPTFAWEMALTFPLMLVVRGLFNGEEIGWRGFALPRLLQRWNALTASLLLGGLWALFHLPIFFVQGASVLGSQTDMNPLAFLIEVTAGAILVTWLFNNTKGSLLIAYLYHAAVNTWTSEVFQVNTVDSAIITVLLAALVVVSYGPTDLTRNPGDQQR